jgi:DegV family protein with EDD domain
MDKIYRDGVDITPGTFYPMLEGSDQLPTTSQPSPVQFQKAFEEALKWADEVVSIHISAQLSATSTSAQIAADGVAKDRIHIIDSGFVSYALALQVLEAARLAEDGATAAEIEENISRLKEKTEFAFTLDTLHYLQKGGRIGRVSALLGTMLGIKPVIKIAEGRLEPVGKARSLRLALQSVVDILAKRYGQERVIVAVGHGAGAEHAAMMLEMVSSALNVEGKPQPFEIGPVVGVHAGPGAVGVAVRPVQY